MWLPVLLVHFSLLLRNVDLQQFFIHSLIDGHLGYFWIIFSITNKVTMNVCEQVFVQIYTLNFSWANILKWKG